MADPRTRDAVATLRRYLESLIAGNAHAAWEMLAPEQRALWPLANFTRDQSGMRGLEACQWAILPQDTGLALVKRWVQISAGYPATTAQLANTRLLMLAFPTVGPKDNSEWEMWLVAPDASGTTFLWNLR